jgi:hypothetical protein
VRPPERQPLEWSLLGLPPAIERKRRMKPVRVTAIDEDGAVTVRTLNWGEYLSYRLGYAAGWLAHGIHDFLRRLRISS